MEPLRIAVASSADVLSARAKGRAFASAIGFSTLDLTLIATAISELARTLLYHERSGELTLHSVERRHVQGIAVTLVETGPARVVSINPVAGGQDNPQFERIARLMDEFEIHRADGGTTVVTRKWRR